MFNWRIKIIAIIFVGGVFIMPFLLQLYDVIKYAKAINIIEVKITSARENSLKDINLQCISPKGHVYEIKLMSDNCKIKSGSYGAGYVTKMRIFFSKKSLNNFESIIIKIGRKEFLYDKDSFKQQWLRISDHFESPVNMYDKRSKIKYFTNIINWPGELEVFRKAISSTRGFDWEVGSFFVLALIIIYLRFVIILLKFIRVPLLKCFNFVSMISSTFSKYYVLLNSKFNNSMQKIGVRVFDLALFLSCGIYILLCLFIFRFIIDDAYIIYLYGRNIIEHGQIVPSINNYIHGYTSFLFVIISAIGYFFGGKMHVEALMKIFLMISGIISIISFNFILKKMKIQYAVNIFTILLATNLSFIVWTMGSLETIFLATLILLLIILYLDLCNSINVLISEIKLRSLFFIAFLIFITRWDTVIFTIPLMISIFISKRKSFSLILKNFLVFFIIPAAAYLFWVDVYYDNFLPRSVNKANLRLFALDWAPVMRKLLVGLEYLFVFMKVNIVSSIGIVVFIYFLVRKKLSSFYVGLRTPIYVLFASVFMYYSYIIIQGDVHMMFTFRFYTPLIPAWFLISAIGYEQILSRLNLKLRQIAVNSLIVCVLLLNTAIFYYAYNYDMIFINKRGFDYAGTGYNANILGQILTHEIWKSAAVYFGEIVEQKADVYCWSAGIFPFYSEGNFYDNLLIGNKSEKECDYMIYIEDRRSMRERNGNEFWKYPINKAPSPKALYYPWHTTFYLEKLRK